MGRDRVWEPLNYSDHLIILHQIIQQLLDSFYVWIYLFLLPFFWARIWEPKRRNSKPKSLSWTREKRCYLLSLCILVILNQAINYKFQLKYMLYDETCAFSLSKITYKHIYFFQFWLRVLFLKIVFLLLPLYKYVIHFYNVMYFV